MSDERTYVIGLRRAAEIVRDEFVPGTMGSAVQNERLERVLRRIEETAAEAPAPTWTLEEPGRLRLTGTALLIESALSEAEPGPLVLCYYLPEQIVSARGHRRYVVERGRSLQVLKAIGEQLAVDLRELKVQM